MPNVSQLNQPDIIIPQIKAQIIVAIIVVRMNFIFMLLSAGAPGSEPLTISPESDCVFTPMGKIPNRTIHQIRRYITKRENKFIGNYAL